MNRALHSELFVPYLDLSGLSAYIIGSTETSVSTPRFRRVVTVLQSDQKRTKKKIKCLENNCYKVEKA